MKIRYGPDFYRQYNKADVKIRNKVDEKVEMFLKDPYDLQLDNHALKRQWKGCRSIDITSDWRAIYKETQIGDETVAYFVVLGSHDELYGKS